VTGNVGPERIVLEKQVKKSRNKGRASVLALCSQDPVPELKRQSDP
jgi:hypothetical protein